MILRDFDKKQQKGFTLLETLVSLGLFALVISVGVGIFVGGSNYQRKTIELLSVQREAGYIMEIVSRELRMGADLPVIDTDNNSQVGQSDDYLEFIDYNWDKKVYCRLDSNGSCDSSGKDFGVGVGNPLFFHKINSTEVEVENLKFYVNDFDAPLNKQKFITVSLTLKSTKKYHTKITLQTSIAMRIY
ncbi:type II secretion system GspH family protein [Patescibacteria group bacterium]|nr:type II secretion system GspH family protein [Patescibacteria group bacterium]